MAIGPLNLDTLSIPQVDIADYIPDQLRAAKRDPLIINQPRAVTALQNKYAPGALFDQLAASGEYTPQSINALRAYDEERVSRGQAPLSEQQTRNALLAATTKNPVVEEPKRNMFNLPGNILKDMGNILKSIPRIPQALVNEVQSLDEIPEAIASAPNPIAGLANAPGIRMLPGAFTIGNIAAGTPGELARQPLFTLLDLLPGAQAAAKTTKVAKTAAELADAARTLPTAELTPQLLASQRLARRPLSTALFNKVDDSGDIVRNTAGEMADMVKQTKAGQTVSEYIGKPSRDAMFAVNAAMQRVRGIMNGTIAAPDNVFAPFAQEAVQFNNKLKEMGLEGQAAEIYDRARTGRIADAPPVMQQAIEMMRDFNTRLATTLANENLAVMFDKELYDLPTGIRLKQQEKGLKRLEELTTVRQRIEAGAIDPTTIKPPETLQGMLDTFRSQRVQEMLNNVKAPRAGQRIPGVKLSPEEQLARMGEMSIRELTLQHNFTIRQLRSAGFDTTELQKAWQFVEGRFGKRNKKGVVKGSVPKNPEIYRMALERALREPDFLPRIQMMNMDDVITTLKGYTRDAKAGPGAKNILFGIQRRDWKSITQGLEQLRRAPLEGLDETARVALVNRLKELRDSGRFIDQRLKDATPEALAKRKLSMEQVKAEAVPARFIPTLENATRQALRDKLIPVENVEEAARLNALIDAGDFDAIPGFDKNLYRTVQREAARQWQAWRDQGLDPVYTHTVTPNKANSAVNPYATIIPRAASSIKKRSWDMAPGVKNVGVSMTHQMMELISREQVQIAIKQIIDQMGETEQALRQRFTPAAQYRASVNDALDFEGHLQQIINEKYKRFDPDVQGYSWGSPYLNRLKQEGMFIPRPVANNLKQLADPKRLLGGALDPVTNLFRVATTSLSLRTQVYNIIGNAVATELARPGATLRAGAQVRKWMKDPSLVPPKLQEIIGSQKNIFMELDKEALGAVNTGIFHYMKGKTLKRLWDQEQATKANRIGQPLDKFKGKVSGLVEKSYDLNGKVDDFYRMVNYIDAYDNAVKKGSSIADAERQAVTAVRENLQDWMSMTPVERSVIRSIFPFYGYMGHAMRFVLRYPLDHPLRTEMMTKLALAELEDQDHLPSRFLSMLFLGGTGPNGEQNAINAGPFNPFGEIASFMSVQGVLGATNPVVSTLLEQAGIVNGEAELYPSLRYDSTTGRLGAAGGNPITAMLHNTIPQSQVFTALMGVNEQYRDMAQRDPAAAIRYLGSGLTIPILWRNIQVDEEVMKAELARQAAQDKVRNEALKTGDWTEALNYPSLGAYLDMIEQLPEEQRAPFMKLTPEQIRSITTNTPSQSTPLPQFQGVEPLDITIEQLLAQPSPIMASNVAGAGPLPGSSLTMTNGGI